MNMKHLYTSLDSGVTSGSVTDNSITDDSVIEIYFDNTDCYIDSTSQSGHTVYFTVGGNAIGTNVCVVVNNLTNFTPYNDADIRERVAQTEQDIINLETTVENLDNLVTTLETDVETLENRVDGLNASNINYDEHSTLYSAMGDIDELETTSKNLVGAINEVKESGGGSGEIYDSTERVIGTWFDKTLYRKVIINQTEKNFGGNTWLDYYTNNDLIDITQAYLVNLPSNYSVEREVTYPLIAYCNASKHINIMHNRSGANLALRVNAKVVIEYTKVGE